MLTEDGKKIGIEDVAKAAGVSTATVSRVINGYKGVSGDVVRRVRDAINILGYELSPNKKELLGFKRLIGIVVPNVENPYSATLIKEFQDILNNLQYQVIIMDSKNDPNKTVESVNELVQIGVLGLIVIPTHTENLQEQFFKNIKVPVVFLGRKPKIKNLCYVDSEIENGTYNGTKYLLSMGHKNIVYLTGNADVVVKEEDMSTDSIGFRGFLRAYKEAGLTFDYNYLISGDYNLEQSHKLILEFATKHKFSAVFASGDIMAYGAIQAVKSLGFNIPEDVSILGFDDLPISSVIDLTTIAKNTYSVGQATGLLLDDLISKRKFPPQEIILPTNLCIRSTCGVSRV